MLLIYIKFVINDKSLYTIIAILSELSESNAQQVVRSVFSSKMNEIVWNRYDV